MFSKTEIRQNLLGCLEIATFMPKGAERFCANRKSMIKSFLIPLIILPLTIITVVAAHPGELTSGSAQVLAMIYSLRLFISLGAFLAFVYFMAKTMDRQDAFYRFATANNWLSIPATVAALPFIILFLNGNHDWASIYPMLVMIALYSYAYTAFMAAHVLRIPFEMAAFIAICGMAINQSTLDALKWVAVSTLELLA